MTDSLDPRTGPTPEDETAEDRAATDPDAMTFFADEPSRRTTAGGRGVEGDATGNVSLPDAGYVGGIAEGNSGSAGIRRMTAHEAREAAASGGVDGPDANLGQQDR